MSSYIVEITDASKDGEVVKFTVVTKTVSVNLVVTRKNLNESVVFTHFMPTDLFLLPLKTHPEAF